MSEGRFYAGLGMAALAVAGIVYVVKSAEEQNETSTRRALQREAADSEVRSRIQEFARVVSSKALSPEETVEVIEFLDPYDIENVYCIVYRHARWQTVQVTCPGATQAQLSMLGKE